MSLVGQNGWQKEFDEHVQEILFLISQNSQLTVRDLWLIVAIFQDGLKQIMENQEKAKQKRREIKNMFN